MRAQRGPSHHRYDWEPRRPPWKPATVPMRALSSGRQAIEGRPQRQALHAALERHGPAL